MAADTLLECIDCRKYFGSVRAVDGVYLQIKRDEVISIVGPNGAGKTTLVNLISGYYAPDHGRIIYEDRDITKLPPHDRVRLGILRSFQLVNLFNNLSVLDNIVISILAKRKLTNKFYSLISRYRDVTEEAFVVLKNLGLERYADELVVNLSQGDKKILDIGCTLVYQPKLLLLDEPTSGVSREDGHALMKKTYSILKDNKISAVIVEHDIEIAFSYAERVVVMQEGRIIAEGHPDEVRKNPEVVKLGYGV